METLYHYEIIVVEGFFCLIINKSRFNKFESTFIAKSQSLPYDKNDDNGATLAKYFNMSLYKFNNKNRKDWDLDDYERALKQVETYSDFVVNELKYYLKGI